VRWRGRSLRAAVDQMVVDASRARSEAAGSACWSIRNLRRSLRLQIRCSGPVLVATVISFHSKGGIYRGRDEIDRNSGS